MYICNGTAGYDRDGAQHARGLFLFVFEDDAGIPVMLDNGRTAAPLLACVRTVTLRQLGHWMMGTARIGPYRVTASGAYGGDGLPGHWPNEAGDRYAIPTAARPFLYPLPESLARAFWQGGGHNSAGTEAPALRAWALANLPALRAGRRRP